MKFYGNQHVRVRWFRFRNWITRLIKRIIIVSAIGNAAIWVLYGAYIWGSVHNPKVVYAEKTVEVIVETKAPILERIYKCESGNNHYDKNGQVLMRPNVNGTIDVGIGQINSVWFKKASELKLDLTKEEDNKKMAEWIYANRGTGDWAASSSCWSK